VAWLDSLGLALNNSRVTLLAALVCANATNEATLEVISAVSRMDLLVYRFMVVPPPLTLVAGHELELKIAVIQMSLRMIAKLTIEIELVMTQIDPTRDHVVK
jgi:hypothetical protein